MTGMAIATFREGLLQTEVVQVVARSAKTILFLRFGPPALERGLPGIVFFPFLASLRRSRGSLMTAAALSCHFAYPTLCLSL